MRRILVCALLLCSPFPLLGKKRPLSQPVTQFEIGRRTFFDFGPPFDFYEVYIVKSEAKGSSVERITITPPGAYCTQPAKVETATASLDSSITVLLNGTNPCDIPEKELHREMKRCKKCLVFSGTVTAMQLQCGEKTRIIRSHVLDRDIYDPAPQTPKYTSWTMHLLEQLDRPLGSNVGEKPVFPVSEQGPAPAASNSEAATNLSSGRYDGLFAGAPDKPSSLYQAAQRSIPQPEIRIETNPPTKPTASIPPSYPPLARLAHIEGKVVLKIRIALDGTVSNVAVESGHAMLRPASENAVKSWKFATEAANQEVEVTIEFINNCPAPSSR